MTYYHNSKQAALEAAQQYDQHFHARAELEPNNGWVIVLSPRTKEVFNWALGPLLEKVEVDLSGYERLRARPSSHRGMPPPPEPKARQRAQAEPTVAPTWKPGEKLPWAK